MNDNKYVDDWGDGNIHPSSINLESDHMTATAPSDEPNRRAGLASRQQQSPAACDLRL